METDGSVNTRDERGGEDLNSLGNNSQLRLRKLKLWFQLSFPTFIKYFNSIMEFFKIGGMLLIFIWQFFKLYPIYIYFKYFKYGIFPLFYKPSTAFKYIHFFKIYVIAKPLNDWLLYDHSNIYFIKIDWMDLDYEDRTRIITFWAERRKFIKKLIREDPCHLHREDGPAKISKNYCKFWAIDGKYHKTDGPAIICKSSGIQQFYINGKRHRIDGPAIEHYKKKENDKYYIHGIYLTKRDFTIKTFKLDVIFN